MFSLIAIIGFTQDKEVKNNYSQFFEEAYIQNPNIPRGILEAVSFQVTRFTHIVHDNEESESCSGYPNTYGVMGLMLNGSGVFKNNLKTIANLSGYSIDEIITSPRVNILAYAKAYSKVKIKLGVLSSNIEEHIPILIELSELPASIAGNSFSMNSFLYENLRFLNNPTFQKLYSFPVYNINLRSFFGDKNYEMLSSPIVRLLKNENNSELKIRDQTTPEIITTADYPPAIWVPAATCNYAPGRTVPISAIAIHDMEGYYAGSISWFQTCPCPSSCPAGNPCPTSGYRQCGIGASSAHYLIRSSDGQVTQMVLESDRAYHIGSENGYTIGIEHEGVCGVNTNTYYSSTMYNSSANLVKDICNDYGINPLRTYWDASCSCSQVCVKGSCIKIKGHQMYPNQTHHDPGIDWDWERYYKLINNNPSITTFSVGAGTFYDSGGPNGNYSDDERKVYVFNATCTGQVSLNFTAFNVENNYDYLFIYNGNNVNAPLIGQYTGTNSPGTVVSTTGSLCVEFRSDCATTTPGWAANYSCTGSACPQPTNDGCSGSFSATLLNFGTSCNPVSSTSCGATNSGFSSCVGNSDDDVFFRFVPTATSATITVASSSGYDAVFQVLTGPCGGSMSQLDCVNNTGTGGTETTTVNGLTIGATYFVRVWHFGTGSGSGTFNICVYGTCSTLNAPNASSATNITSTTFQSNWSSISGVTSYRLDVSTNSGFTSYVPGYQDLNVGNVIFYNVTGLSCNTSYFYRVRAFNNCGPSINSNVVSLTTSGCCTAPLNPNATPATNITSNTFQANWSSVGGVTYYSLDVSTNSAFSSYLPGYQDLNIGNTTAYNVTGLTCNIAYYYRVRANNNCGQSINSNIVNLVTNACCTPPNIPQLNTASNITATSFVANWNLVSGATTYLLDVSTNSNFSTYVPGYQGLNVGNFNSFNVTGLTCQASYYYRLRSFNSCGASQNSATLSVSTSICCTPPNIPFTFNPGNVTASSFIANWSFVGGATLYYLDVSTNSNFSSYVLGYQNLNAGNNSSLTVTGLNCNTVYYYRVRAYNNCGPSLNSATIGLNTSNCCTPPNGASINFATNVTATSFTGSWSLVSGATSYFLDVSTNANFTSFVNGYNNLNVGNNNNWFVQGLFCNTMYYYRVRAYNNCGYSANSAIINVLTTFCCNPPGSPLISLATNLTTTSFRANWNPVAGATSYLLDVATNPNFINFVSGYNSLNTGFANFWTVSNLDCNTTYFYRVRVLNNCGPGSANNYVYVTTFPCFVQNIDGLDEFTVYPNPNDGQFSVKIRLSVARNVAINIYNSVGQVFYQAEPLRMLGSYKLNITLPNITNGFYYLSALIDDIKVTRKIFVTNR